MRNVKCVHCTLPQVQVVSSSLNHNGYQTVREILLHLKERRVSGKPTLKFTLLEPHCTLHTHYICI